MPDPGDRLARAFEFDCEGPNALAKLARYESAIERSIDRSLRQLKLVQQARIAAEASAEPSSAPLETANCKANPSPEPQRPTTDHQPPTTNPNSPAAPPQPPTTSHQPPPTGHQPTRQP
jgi:hypothetical protein